MSLLEELLKSSKTHSQTVIVALFAVIAVGTIGGGIWIHNLQSALENQDALQKQRLDLAKQEYDTKVASIRSSVYGLEHQISVLSITVTQHEVFLDQANTKLKQVAKQIRSAEVRNQIEQIESAIDGSKAQIEQPRQLGLDALTATRSNLTGSAGTAGPPWRPFPAPPPNLLCRLVILVMIVIGVFWIGVYLYKRYRERQPHN